ncbi:MAG TPA: molybdenum ABC transporter ATP-binding protein [Alphaproteobacteria bacterium]|nr:molybdenum ABC transporter ATP-binding protein [Alphaproteobacteria bacterium]
MIEVEIGHAVPEFSLDVKFVAGPGVTALFGPSGAGKTMAVGMIAGLDRPARGRIAIDGTVLFDSESGVNVAPERRGVGYVFQEDRLFPHMSVATNLRYGRRRRHGAGPAPAPFDDIVALLDLGNLLERLPHNLSGGERQRVAIGRALLSRPRVLLMDEPLAGLDAARREEILPFLESLRAALAVPIVYVSHSLDEVSRLADTLVLLDRGRVTAAGPLQEVLGRLDLPGLDSLPDAGSVLDVTLESHDDADGLSVLAAGGARLIVPRIEADPGSLFRIRIQARDVAIAREAPKRISTLNILPGTVTAVGGETGATPGNRCDVMIDVGAPLRARLTRRSVRELELAPGVRAYAVIKAVAVRRRGTPETGL